MTDNLVVGGMLGAALVTTLFFTQRLAVLAQTLLQGIGSATWASFADLHARGEHATFNRRLVELSRLVAVLSVAGLGPIVAYNRHFVGVWMGPEFTYGGEAVIIIAAINAFLIAQFSLWGWCFSATGQTHRVVVSSIAAAVVNVAASIALTRSLGLIGPLLGSTVAFVAVSLWNFPWLLGRVFGTSIAALVRAVLVPLACGLPYAWGLWWVAQHHQPLGRIGLAAEMGLACPRVRGSAAAGDPLERGRPHFLWRLRC